LDYKRKVNPSFSARAWAKKMGFANHSLLSLLMSGSRPIRVRHLDLILKGLDLNEEEENYFSALVGYHSSENDTERGIFEEKLVRYSNISPNVNLDIEKFKFISNWMHTAILEMTALHDFQQSPSWIANRIGRGISTKEVEGALQRLFALGLLEERDGKWKKTKNFLTIDPARASRAVREYHKQVIALAHDAVDSQNREERILNSFTLTIDEDKLPQAEKIFEDFRKQITALLSKQGGDETYQCNLQLFRITKAEYTFRGEA
jgi:uncharacterized protein (TIGR02147 family)